MKRLLLLDIILYGILFNNSWAWWVNMPSSIHGLHKSCLVIPCSFGYYAYPPHNPYRIVWYQYVKQGYPKVFDSWHPASVIDRYRGRTRIYKGTYRDCSLVIEDLSLSHEGDRIYTWVDPENIGWTTYKFYDVTTVIHVDSSPQQPTVDISGGFGVGERIEVQCYTYHTCPSKNPTLSLSGIEKKSGKEDRLEHVDAGDGKWKIILTREGIVQSERQEVHCSVRHPGGLSAFTTKIHNAQCYFYKPVISPAQDEVMEGIEKTFTCTVKHTCQKKPNIMWNYQNMPVSVETHKVSTYSWQTVSTLKLKASRDDHGKTLTCTAKAAEQETSDHVTLKVKRGMSLVDWTYSMPSKIKGLRGSCLVIPCSFHFRKEKPSNVDVKWYLYATREHPLVYGPDIRNVIGKYFGKTSLYGLASENYCSLEIKQVDMNHNGDRLYPWMDPKSVQAFHMENYYDNTLELQITEQANKPKLSIIGIPRVGEQITVSCSVLHTCPPNPPSLSVGKALETDITVHNPVKDGFWEITRIHTFIITEGQPTVICKATFHGGQTSEAHIDLNPQCTYKDITIDPEVADVIEGVGINFTCTVFHSCKYKPPVVTWNYKDIPETNGTKKGPSLTWATYSNVLFIASMEDDGKKLTCTATVPGAKITNSIVLQVKRYVPKVVDPFENDTLHIFEANVVPRISALTRSCVVIPCTFQLGDLLITRLRGLWYTTKGEYVYHTGKSNIADNFKGRTILLGNPDEQNCTLEIDDVQAHDNGPFCFHAEKDNDKYRFNHSCVFIIMKATPDKPVISALPEEMEPGKRFTINCSVTHTCSSHPPSITWNVPATREVVSHKERSAGKWETISKITFIPTGYEEEENLICRATFRGGKYQESSTLLSVKRYERLGMDFIGLYIILPLFLLLLFCTAAGIIIYKRRAQKKTSDESTPERRRSIWSYLSRRSHGGANWLGSSVETSDKPPRPPKPEKRRSIWSRFSRSGPVSSRDLTVQYKVNNVGTGDTSVGYSKARRPSPTSQPKFYH